MSDHEEDDSKHQDFLVSMSNVLENDSRFKLIHGNDDRPILDQPLADILGENVTVESLFKSKSDFKTSYDKTVKKNKGLRLQAPPSTVQEAKISRSATHKVFTKQMSKWDAAVHSRRAAESVSFPLQKPDMGLKSAKDQTVNFKNQTPLEQEVAKLLYGSKAQAEDAQLKDNTVGLSIREMREKLSDLARIRAHEQYQQAKLKRQNKIKSKKYRRQLRKEKRKELEAMGVSKEDSDLQRITERASLKHTKASKNLHFIAKHSDKTIKNQVLAEKDRKKQELKAKEDVTDDDDEEEDSDAEQVEPLPPTVEEHEAKLLELVQANAEKKKEDAAKKNVNPNDFLQVHVKNGANFADGDASSDDEVDEILAESRNKITEAFANDEDILRDFKQEAKEKAEAKRAKNAKPAAMPGWGNWGSSTNDMKNSRKRKCEKKRAFLREKAAKMPKESKRDGDSGYRVIVNDSAKGNATRAHQTSSVPFPFTSVGDFESSIRMPVGETFVPRTSFKKMTQPKVKVAKGAVIEAVDKSELVKRGIKFEDKPELDIDCGTF